MRTKRLLVVDDSPGDVALCLEAFRMIGFQHRVEVARDGVEAMANLRRSAEPPELILLDLKMPRMGGLEVLSAVRADPRLKHCVVVILTSSDEERDKTRAQELGADLYVRKPVDFEQFVEVARQVSRTLDILEPEQTAR